MEDYELFQKLHFIQVPFKPNGSVIITLTKMEKNNKLFLKKAIHR